MIGCVNYTNYTRPLEIENFFVEGVNEMGLEVGQEPSKTLLRLFNQQKTKI